MDLMFCIFMLKGTVENSVHPIILQVLGILFPLAYGYCNALRERSSITDQERILALLAAWTFHRKPTAKRAKFSIGKVLLLVPKQ